MNPLAPGLNRVEADELSYGLHIMIRTDLEIALLEQGLPVEELPAEWNRRYGELLGVTPANDAIQAVTSSFDLLALHEAQAGTTL